MQTAQPARSLAAIVFTDVVGYSALSHTDDAKALRMVEEHFEMAADLAPRFGGRVIKTIGDSVHMEFASAQSATACAIAIQQGQQRRNARVSESDRFVLRIGVHLGDIEHRGGDTYGDGVNIAARLQPLAPKGGIAISEHVRGQLREELRKQFVSRGPQSLKNIGTPIEMFVIEADAIAGIAVEVPGTPRPQPEKRASKWRYAVIAIAVLSLIPLAMFGIALMPFVAGKKAAVVGEKSLAVLPFANTGGDPANEYFADGMSEELINTLGRVENLKVMGRTSSFQFKNTRDDPRTIGQKLGVGYLVDGSVRKASDRVRIGVALVRAEDGSNLWSESYDRDLKDIFGVQTEIATAVTGELQRSLGVSAKAPPLSKPGAGWPPGGNVEAYEALLQGNFHSRRATNADDLKAMEFYQRAIALDPRYALAHAQLASAGLLNIGTSSGPAAAELDGMLDRVRAAVATALQLDPELARAHLAQAQLYRFELRFEDAEREYLRAAELAPNDAGVIRELGVTQSERGHIGPALSTIDRAVELDPLSRNAHFSRGLLLDLTGRFAEAELAFRRAIEVEPQSSTTRALLAISRMHQGDTAAAIEIAREETDPFWRRWAMAMALFAHGDRKQADAELDAMIRENAQDAAFQIAEIYAVRRDPDAAFLWLDRALANKDPGVTQIHTSSLIAAYRSDPRYAAVARKSGLDPANAQPPS
jgi:TolB-like protein/class 3 adenylate cyclase/tetratricopeptide (TPR) repeat protein